MWGRKIRDGRSREIRGDRGGDDQGRKWSGATPLPSSALSVAEDSAEAAELVHSEEVDGVGRRYDVGGHGLGHSHGCLGSELAGVDYDKVVAREVALEIFGHGVHVAVE